jgi:pimeloyl-ACP methyl ester carboxylesterase
MEAEVSETEFTSWKHHEMSRYFRTILLAIFVSLGCLTHLKNGFAQNSPDVRVPPTTVPPGIDELLLFFPSKHPAGDWTPQDLVFEDVWFKAKDETRIHAWYCPCENPRAIILIAHGNAGNIAMRAPWLRHLQTQLRVSTLMFDYRGYGRSEGIPSVDGALQDARAARTKLLELTGQKDLDVLLMGESLGGAVAVQLAAEAPPRALILQSTFPSLRELAEVHYPRLAWLVPQSKLNSASQIGGVRCPLLQSHGTADRTIPLALGEKLFQMSNDPKTFVKIVGADHNNWLTRDYFRQLDSFIRTVERPNSR